MICKNCGGEIAFKNGAGVCLSCGAQIKIDGAFENAEVYICYTENDLAGRHVKDSLIANEIYNKLENAKIKTFYERVSVGNIVGDELEMTRYQALYNAKVIIILGTTPDYFNQLFKKNGQYFDGKAVLPVCVDMSPAQLPQELTKYQAANYNNVGAAADLIKTVLKALGREEEIALGEVITKAQKKKKRLIISLSIAAAVLILGVSVFFAVNYYLNSGDRLNEKNYNAAMTLIEQEKYLDAAQILQTTLDYKDSKNQLKKIYDRYDGYYLNQNEDISLYINVKNSSVLEIEVIKNIDDRKIRFSAEVEFKNNIGNIEFTDNASNEGKATITLFDDAIEVITVITEAGGEYSVGNFTETFYIKDKTDKPQDSEITRLTVMKWLSKKTTASDLEQYGCELVFEGYLSNEGGWNDNTSMYRIANTDIKVLLVSYDIDKNVTSYESADENHIDDAILYGVMAPAELMLPDNLGQTVNRCYLKGNIIFGIGAVEFQISAWEEWAWHGYIKQGFSINSWFDPCIIGMEKQETLSADTMVAAISKESVGETIYEIYYDYYVHLSKIDDIYETFPELNDSYALCLLENEKSYLLAVHVIEYTENNTGNESFAFYRANKNEKTLEMVCEANNSDFNCINDIFQYSKSHPELIDLPAIVEEDEEPGAIESETDSEEYFVGRHYDADGVNYLEIAGNGEAYTVTMSIGDIYCYDVYATYDTEKEVLEFEYQHFYDDTDLAGEILQEGDSLILKITESGMDELPIDSEYKFLL